MNRNYSHCSWRWVPNQTYRQSHYWKNSSVYFNSCAKNSPLSKYDSQKFKCYFLNNFNVWSSRCENGRTCNNLPYNYNCTCPPGYYGRTCEGKASANNFDLVSIIISRSRHQGWLLGSHTHSIYIYLCSICAVVPSRCLTITVRVSFPDTTILLGLHVSYDKKRPSKPLHSCSVWRQRMRSWPLCPWLLYRFGTWLRVWLFPWIRRSRLFKWGQGSKLL